MKTYFAYIRVSTQRQGEHGVSLQEQKSEIEKYASQRGLRITTWFEERETAAILGRPVFSAMLGRLRKREATGVIIHKIDRSARNLRDWSDVTELTDDGIEVHFTRESLDLQSSSGRFAADVQAVVAANYVRNLREETIKGLYGRLKQGIYPMPAPLGYLNKGAGQPKTIDPVRGPMLREGFRLYATGQYSQQSLADELFIRGLRTREGEPVSKTTLAGILSNPFYYGLIFIRKNRQAFKGAHEPLISRELFEQVKEVLAGRGQNKPIGNVFLFSRLIQCRNCSRSLIAETQKGHVYYRCHTRRCPITSFREEAINRKVLDTIERLHLHPYELQTLEDYVRAKRSTCSQEQQKQLATMTVHLSAIKDRLNRLTDAYIDGHIDADLFNQRKETLLAERLEYEGKIHELSSDPSAALRRLEEFVELVKRVCLQYEEGNLKEKRQILQSALLNRIADAKKLEFTLQPRLSQVTNRPLGKTGGPSPRESRTFWMKWLNDRA